MTKSREQVLKEKYGFNKASYDYVPKGAELLKCIGETVVLVEFKKDEEGKWNDNVKFANIISIYDFEPMTMTYMCKYKEKDSEEEQEIRIQPEGFSYENPEETGEFKRFIPYSLHCKLVEDEMFHLRCIELFEKRNSLGHDSLINLTNTKEQATQLRYSRNICAIIKMIDGTILCLRVLKINYHHKSGNNYTLSFSNDERNWTTIIEKDAKEFDFENGIGTVKLIDLSD